MDGDINRNQPLFDPQNRIFLSVQSPISPHRQYLGESSSNTMMTQDERRDLSNRLIPVYVNMNRRETMEEHSTIYYNTPELVLRRGQEFSCILLFNQAFQSDKYQLIIVFKSQTWRNFPVIKIPLNESSNGWSVKINDKNDENQKKNQLQLRVCSSPSALIGKYSFFLEIRSADKAEPNVFQFESDFYLICNPWKDEDSCGLLSDDQIAEYVMNEHGEIYLGSSEIPRAIPWYFGQFESPVLPTALTILNRIQLPVEQRIDVSIILRILAARICSDPGTFNGIFRSLLDIQPLSCMENAYTSSPAILKQFATSNGQSVAGDSGTNWQHAAVFCSLCRALGIPCRVVTVYNAISDVKGNANITCPWYLWNECWIRRDDLPKENSGWQVMNSSFNSPDTKTQRLGPCSVRALKNGSLELKCDTSALHSLINGNQKLSKDAIKRKIITKSSKDNQGFDDLTNDYTSGEVSDSTSSAQDVQIDIEVPDCLKSSENLTVILKANNRSNVPHTLALALALFRINPIEQSRNNPNDRFPIQSLNQIFRLDPNQLKTVPVKVAENHQVWAGCFDSVLQLSVHGLIQETGQKYRQEKYIVNGESIAMKIFLEDDVIEIGQSTKLNIEIKNSPSYGWNHGHITVDGFGILESLSIRKDSTSSDSTKIPFRLVPTRMGLGRLYVTFSTESLCLAPQTILLEVTGWTKKKPDADYHLARQSSLEELLQTSTDEETLHKDKQSEDNLISTSGIFTAPTEVVHEQQETPALSTSESTVDNQEKSLVDEQKTETPSLTTIAPLQSELKTAEELENDKGTPSTANANKESSEVPQSQTEIVEKTTEIKETSRDQDAAGKPPSEEKAEPQTTTVSEPVSIPSVQATVDETTTKGEEPKLSSIPQTDKSEEIVATTTSVEEYPEEVKNILSKSPPQDSSNETIAETKQDRNQPEQTSSSDLPATDDKIEVTTVEDVTGTTKADSKVPQEIKPDNENKLTEPVTEVTTIENASDTKQSPDKAVVGQDQDNNETQPLEKEIVEEIRSPEISSPDTAVETSLRTETTEPSISKEDPEKLVETVTKGDDSTNITPSDTTNDVIPTAPNTSSSEQSKKDNEDQLQSTDRLEVPLAKTLSSEVEGTDAEPSISEASSIDNVNEVPHRQYIVHDEEEDRDTELPTFSNRNAALRAANDMASAEPGNRLTPASRCYSVETVIDTVTVGDKTEEVELIVLKPQAWYDSTTSLNSITTDTNSESSEQPGIREVDTNVETEPSNIRTKTVTQTVKVGDQDEEVETIVLRAPSLNDITERATAEEPAKDQETKAAEKEKSSSDAATPVSIVLSPPKRGEASAEGDLSKIPTLDPAVKAAEPSPVISFTRPSTSEVEETDTDPFISETSSLENLSDVPYRQYIVDDETEDRDTDLPKFSNRNAALRAANDLASAEPGNRLTPASRCYSVETVIDTVTVGDKMEEVELIVLKPQSWYDSTITLNEAPDDIDNKTSAQQENRTDDTSDEDAVPDYRTKTVTQTVKVGDQEEEVETIILKAPSLEDISDKRVETQPIVKSTSDEETRLRDISSSEPELNRSSGLSTVEEESLSNAASLDAGVETITQSERAAAIKRLSQPDQSKGLTEQTSIDSATMPMEEELSKTASLDATVPLENKAESESDHRIVDTPAQTVTDKVEHTDTEPSMSETSSIDNDNEVPYRQYIVDDETEDRDTELPTFSNRNAALKAANDMSAGEPGNRLTPASRCYSVETVIDTVTVGDKTEEVELIVLKPQAWYDSTITLNEAPADADNETSEKQENRADDTSAEDAAPGYRIKTVTQTVKVGDQEEEVETIILKAPSLIDISGILGETATTEKDAADLRTNLSSISSSEERTETTPSENPSSSSTTEVEKQSSPSQVVLPDETKNADEGAVESEKEKSWEIPSLGNQIETEIPSATRDEEVILQKAPSTGEIISETTDIEQRNDQGKQDGEEGSLSKFPSLDVRTDAIPAIPSMEDREEITETKLPNTGSVTELPTTGASRESSNRSLFKVPSLGDLMDSLTELRMILDGVPDDRMAISEPSSVNDIPDMFPDVYEPKGTREDERRSTPDVSSSNKVSNTKEPHRRSLPKVPSLGDIPETALKATPAEEKKEEEEEEKFPKIPSLDIEIPKIDKESEDTETVRTTDEDTEKSDLTTLSGSPFIANLSSIVTDIIGTPSTSTTDTTTETSITEERRPSQEYTIPRVPSLENIGGINNTLEDANQRRLPKVPSLEDMTRQIITTTTTTTTVEEVEPEESKIPEVPSLVLESDTISQKENTEDVKNSTEPELLSSSSLEMPTTTVSDVSTTEENTETNGQQLPKVPSLEDLTQTTPVAITDEHQQDEDKPKLPRVPSLDFTAEALTKPTIDEVKQEEEEMTSQISSPTIVTEETTNDDVKISEPEEEKPERQSPDILSTSSTVDTSASENIPLDRTLETVPQNIEIEIQSVPAPEKEDESSSLTSTATVSSVFEPSQPQANDDETTTEETLSTASTFESEPITLEKTESTTDDTDSSASTVQQNTTTESVTSTEPSTTILPKDTTDNEPPTTTTTEAKDTDEESDTSLEDLKDWLDGLLQQLSAADETDRDGEVNILHSSVPLAVTPPVSNDTTADVEKIEETTEFNDDTNKPIDVSENSSSEDLVSSSEDRLPQSSTTKFNSDTNKPIDVSEKSSSEDLTSSTEERLPQSSTTEETSTNVESAEHNVLVEQTTVTTEIMTNEGEDSSTEGTSRILKYVVLQTGESDDSDRDDDDESKTEVNNDSTTTVIAAETPLSTSNIPEEETVVDRTYINTHRDANITASDGSAVAIISDDDRRNSHDMNPRTNSMSTMKDADSLSDAIPTETDHDFSNQNIYSLIQFADVLSDDILESAVLWTINESYDNTPSSSPTTSTSFEQFIPTNDAKLIVNTSIKSVVDNEETISDKSNGQ